MKKSRTPPAPKKRATAKRRAPKSVQIPEIKLWDGTCVEPVALRTLQNGDTAAVVRDGETGTYVMLIQTENGYEPTPHLFREIHEVLRVLPLQGDADPVN